MNDDDVITRLRELHDSIEPPLTSPGADAGRGQRMLRRRRTAWAGATAAAVLVGIGAISATTDGLPDLNGSGSSRGPDFVGEPTPSEAALGVSEQVGVDALGRPISVALPGDVDGFPGPTGVISEKDHAAFAGLAVFQPRTIAGGSSACTSDSWAADARTAAPTAERLGQQLARLPEAEILDPVAAAPAYGYPGVHLRLRVNNGCPEDEGNMLAEADPDFGLAYGSSAFDVEVDFQVVDVDGTPIVVAAWHAVDASDEMVARITEIRDAITLVAGS